MRVIGGEFRSRRLKAPPGTDVRPTPDRLRETLFNILAARIEGAVFVDAYAGTGAVGIEALSRGASRAIFIESNRETADIIRDNLTTLGLRSRSEVFTGKVLQSLERLSAGASIVFLDPPYDKEREYAAAMHILGDRHPCEKIGEDPKRAGEDARPTSILEQLGKSSAGLWPAGAIFSDTFSASGLVIAQHSIRLAIEEQYGGLRRYRVVKQGDNVLSFYNQSTA